MPVVVDLVGASLLATAFHGLRSPASWLLHVRREIAD